MRDAPSPADKAERTLGKIHACMDAEEQVERLMTASFLERGVAEGKRLEYAKGKVRMLAFILRTLRKSKSLEMHTLGTN